MQKVLFYLYFITCFFFSFKRNNFSIVFNSGKTDTSTVYLTSTSKLKSNKIPDSVFKLYNLKKLSIMGMDCDYGNHIHCWMITEIPSKIKNLKNLEYLQLNVNALSKLPIELAELQKLKIVDFTDNSDLNDITVVCKLKNLESLTVFGCGLNNLPKEIGSLTKLKYLGLTGNSISKTELERIKKALPTCEVAF